MKASRKIDSCIHNFDKRIPNDVLIHILCPSTAVAILVHTMERHPDFDIGTINNSNNTWNVKNRDVLSAANCRVATNLSQIIRLWLLCKRLAINALIPSWRALMNVVETTPNWEWRSITSAVIRSNLNAMATTSCGLTIWRVRLHGWGCPVEDGDNPCNGRF